jgi:hypothetical protein
VRAREPFVMRRSSSAPEGRAKGGDDLEHSPSRPRVPSNGPDQEVGERLLVSTYWRQCGGVRPKGDGTGRYSTGGGSRARGECPLSHEP